MPVWEQESSPLFATSRIAVGANDRILVGGDAAGVVHAFDSVGRPLWSASGQPGGASQTDVALLTGGEAVATYSGQGANDYDVARFSISGALLGQGRYGGLGIDDARGIAAHPQGGYVVVGTTAGGAYGGSPASGSGTYSGFIARHDANGIELWVVRLDQQGRSVIVADVACLPSGQIVAVGFTSDATVVYPNLARFRVDASGQNAVLTMGVFGSYQTIDAAPDGTYVVTGTVPSATGVSSGVIHKYSPSGAPLLLLSIASAFFAPSYAYAATLDETGGIYAWVLDSSPMNVGSPVFNGLVRFSATGVKSWEIAYRHSTAHSGLGRYGDLYVTMSGPARIGRFSQGLVGAQVCAGQTNSTGAAAATHLAGTAAASENALVLFSESLPPGQSVLYLVADGVASLPNPGGSQGTLCLGLAIGRFNQPSQIAIASTSGIAHLGVDLSALPRPMGFQAAVVGQIWNFQAWYRDANPHPTTNFTSAVAVMIQ
jgi:hypothetical protein